MKFLIPALFITTSAFAAVKQYDLKIDYALNGKTISGSHVIVKEGETATVFNKRGNEESFVEVTPVPDVNDPKNIKMKFVLGTIEDGERRILSTPEIMTETSVKGEVQVSDKLTEDTMSLSVLAKEKGI